MKSIVVEDFVYDQFQIFKSSLGIKGTSPHKDAPGYVSFGYDDTGALMKLISVYKTSEEIKRIALQM